MYRINRILLFCFLPLIVLVQTSCNFINTTDVEPVGELTENQAITNISGAQNLLYGTYGLIKGSEFYAYMPGTASLMGLTMSPGRMGGSAFNQFYINNVLPDNSYIDMIYTKLYEVINNANQIVSKTKKLDTDDPQKETIIAQAKFLRALANFELLHRFAQFYDINSDYGIVLRKEPVKNAKPLPRSSVKEAYSSIINDLTYAIKNGPEFDNPFYASRLAAKALKSRVLLYKKEYKESAILAQKVISSSKIELETTYAAIFKKKIKNTKGVIFQIPFDEKHDRNNKGFMFNGYFQPSEYYIDFMEGTKRDSVAISQTESGNYRNNKYNGTTFNGQSLTADTQYFLRLDQVYLIYAEAVLRKPNGSVSKARNALNKIRERAGANPISSTTKKDLLEDIRKEKILELGAENGVEWFDLIRYAVEGDLDISKFKPEVKSTNQYILPLPLQSIQLSNGVVEQNPGY